MAASKRGGHASIITEHEGTISSGKSSTASRSGVSKNLTTDELAKNQKFLLEQSTKQVKGSSSGPSTGNRARIVKGENY